MKETTINTNENIDEKIKNEILITDVYDDMRLILSKIPNKNSLYRDIDLSLTYLNLKHYVKNNENIKPRSEKAILDKLGYKKVILYVKEDTLENDEKQYLNFLQNQFLIDLNNYSSKFLGERRRFSSSQVTKEDIRTVNEYLNSYKSYDLDLDLKLDDLTIE